MATTTNVRTLWVCVDCYFAAAYGADEIADLTPERAAALLSLVDSRIGHLTTGLIAEEHAEDCPAHHGETVTDDTCECDHIPFSPRDCDGCGDPLAGDRHALTAW